MANDLVELQVSEEEVSLLTMSLGLLITMMDEDISRKHKKGERGGDFDLDEVFFLMDKKFGAMNLWRKVLVSAGADPEELANHISKATKEEME
jgi:hypothetical protein